MDTYQQNSKEFLPEHPPGDLFLFFHGLDSNIQHCRDFLGRVSFQCQGQHRMYPLGQGLYCLCHLTVNLLFQIGNLLFLCQFINIMPQYLFFDFLPTRRSPNDFNAG